MSGSPKFPLAILLLLTAARPAAAATPQVEAEFPCGTPVPQCWPAADHLVLDCRDAHYWVCIRLRGIAGRTLRIDFANVNLAKEWSALNPLVGAGVDLDDPAAFASDPVPLDAEGKPVLIAAANGSRLPAAAGRQWTFVPEVWYEPSALTAPEDAARWQAEWTATQRRLRPGIGALCMRHTFSADADTAVVATRYPYTPELNRRYLESLPDRARAARLRCVDLWTRRLWRHQGWQHGLHAIEIGETQDLEGRPQPGVVLYAREHGREPDGSWVLQGAIEFLLSDDPAARAIRRRHRFTIIPVLDPEGAERNLYERMTHHFSGSGPERIEAGAWAAYFQERFDRGECFDLMINLHNIVANELPHLAATTSPPGPELSRAAWRFDMEELRPRCAAAGFWLKKREDPQGGSFDYFRLDGYLAYFYGGINRGYEVNLQQRDRHLALYDLRQLGRILCETADAFLAGEAGRAVLAAGDAARNRRRERWARTVDFRADLREALDHEWWAARGGFPPGVADAPVEELPPLDPEAILRNLRKKPTETTP
jgi:hypothetical protein